jgi:large subunit ribosomal protein L25
MAEFTLKAIAREDTGKGAARRSRASGKVPGILYGRGLDPVPLEVDRREFVTALHTDAGMNVLLDIEVNGTNTLALTRELQRDPVRGTLLHADFVKVDRTQAIEIDVPVNIVGESPGQKEGGVLEQPLHRLQVRCLPTDVPESVEADISRLGIGDSLRVSDLATGRDFQILNDPDAVVVSIAAPISEEELEAMEAEAGVVHEPTEEELVAEAEAVAAEEGEPAEGEAPAEEEQPAQEPGEGE